MSRDSPGCEANGFREASEERAERARLLLQGPQALSGRRTRWSDREASAKHLLDHRIECGHVNRFFQNCDTGLRRARIADDR